MRAKRRNNRECAARLTWETPRLESAPVAEEEEKAKASEDAEDSAADEDEAPAKKVVAERKAAAKAADRDEEGGEKDADEAADDEKEADEERDADDSDDEKEADEAGAEEDAAAKRVAAALGVEEGEGEEAAEAKEPEAAPNRASRRREEALERRRKRRAKSEEKPSADDDDADLPKDRNARAKALLQKRRESAKQGKTPINLLPGEMVDDAFARGTAAAGKWLRKNFSAIQWLVVIGVLGGVGFLVYNHFTTKKAANASDTLAAGIEAEEGRILAEDKRSDEEKEADPTRIFKTVDERDNAALASYMKVAAEHAGAGAAILARLGEAGVLLDKRDWQGAIDVYQQVLSSPLAAADLDVKGRTLEGLGLAKEGKGDTDGALATFKDLEGIDIKGMKELAWYHQARIDAQKGDKEKAKELLKKAHEALGASKNEGHAYVFLPQVVDEALHALDPTALPPKAPTLGGAKGGAMTPEDMARIQQKLQEMQQKAGQREEQH